MRSVWFCLIVGVCGTAALAGLGYWQLQRLEWKEAILSEMAARLGSPAGGLPDHPTAVSDRYRNVRLEGAFTNKKLLVLTTRNGAPAYRVIAPFVAGDRRILVDRGTIPASNAADERPPLIGELVGNLHWPQEVDLFTPAPDRAKSIWYARDVTAMAQELKTEEVLVVQSASIKGSNITPWPVSVSSIANNHRQYAITWFTLAAIWLAMTLGFIFGNRSARWPCGTNPT